MRDVLVEEGGGLGRGRDAWSRRGAVILVLPAPCRSWRPQTAVVRTPPASSKAKAAHTRHRRRQAAASTLAGCLARAKVPHGVPGAATPAARRVDGTGSRCALGSGRRRSPRWPSESRWPWLVASDSTAAAWFAETSAAMPSAVVFFPFFCSVATSFAACRPGGHGGGFGR